MPVADAGVALPSQTAIIGTAGGTLDLPLEMVKDSVVGEVNLDVPPGALDKDVELRATATHASAATAGEGEPLFRVELEPSGTQFNEPVEVVFQYDRSKIPPNMLIAEDSLELVLLDTESGQWIPVEGSKWNPDDSTVTASITHFSTYALFAANFRWGPDQNQSNDYHYRSAHPPVISVHGFQPDQGANKGDEIGRDTFGRLRALLICGDDPVELFTFTYNGYWGVVQGAQWLAWAVDEALSLPTVRRPDGGRFEAVSLISHSMGGLVARAYLQGCTDADCNPGRTVAPRGHKVERLITLGTPHDGVDEAELIGAYVIQARQLNARRDLTDLRKGSTLLDNLNSQEPAELAGAAPNYRVIYGSFDRIVDINKSGPDEASLRSTLAARGIAVSSAIDEDEVQADHVSFWSRGPSLPEPTHVGIQWAPADLGPGMPITIAWRTRVDEEAHEELACAAHCASAPISPEIFKIPNDALVTITSRICPLWGCTPEDPVLKLASFTWWSARSKHHCPPVSTIREGFYPGIADFQDTSHPAYAKVCSALGKSDCDSASACMIDNVGTYDLGCGSAPLAPPPPPQDTDESPMIVDLSLPSAITLGETAFLEGRAMDDRGVATVEMLVSGPRGDNLQAFKTDVLSASVSLAQFFFDSAHTGYANRAGDYSVQLRVTDTAGHSDEESVALTVREPEPEPPPPASQPLAPMLDSPADRATVAPGAVSFHWSASSQAARYHLMVCTHSALTDGCVNPDGAAVGVEPEAGVRSASVALGAGTYYWAVRAIRAQDVAGWGEFSPARVLNVTAGSGGSGGTSGGSGGTSGGGAGGGGVGGTSGGCDYSCSPGLTTCGPNLGHVYLCPSSGCAEDATTISSCQAGHLCTGSSGSCNTLCGGEGQPCCEDNSASACTIGSCVNGTCVSATCPAIRDCSGRECGLDPVCATSCGSCAQDEACSGGQCVAQVCTPYANYCVGLESRRCSGDGLSYQVMEICQYGCIGSSCQPQCSSDAQCTPSQNCVNDSCVDDICPQGQLYCVDQQVWLCNANGSGSIFSDDCPHGCDAGACIPECVSAAQCMPLEHCDAGECVFDVCAQGETYCRTSTHLSLCSDDGASYDDIQTCGYGCDVAQAACSDCPSDCTGLCGGADDGCGRPCEGCLINQVCQGQTCVGDPCSPDPCGGHGTCSTGECTCAVPYTGRYCDQCAAGYSNDYPACTPQCSAGSENVIETGSFDSPALAWNGTGYGLAYQAAQTSFRRLDTAGVPTGAAPTVLGTSNEFIGVAWSPAYSRYGMVWGTATASSFQCVSATGEAEGAVINLCGAGSTYCRGVSITSNGVGFFGVTWADDRTGEMRIWFNRVASGSCELTGPDTQVSTVWGRTPSVAYSSLLYAIAWIDQTGGLWLTRLDQFGVKFDDLPITTTHAAPRPVIAGLGGYADWGIVWSDDPSGSYQVFFQRANEQLGLVGTPTAIGGLPSTSANPRIAASADGYGIFALEASAPATGYFQRLTRLGAVASPRLPLTTNTIGGVGSDGEGFMTVFAPGTSRAISCLP